MFSSKPKFDPNKLKVQMKMLINRLNLLSSKKGNLAKAEKRKVAMLLREDKEHNARILVEQIIREDYTLEAYDLLKQYTEMLLARFGVIVTEEELRPEIADAVCALVYSGWIMGTEIDELKMLFNLFTLKYGKVYTQEVLDNKEKYINPRLLKILSSTQVPDPSVVDAYLTEIAKAYGVEYIPRPSTSVQPVSATLGIALPTPGMPMPVAPTATELADVSDPSPSAPVPVPMAQPVELPPSGAAPYTPPVGVPIPYTAQLTKSSVTGFGLVLDADNVITAVKPNTEAAGLFIANIGHLAVGDRVLAINGKPVSTELPAKSLCADIDAATLATFTMLRLPGVGGPPTGVSAPPQAAGIAVLVNADVPPAAAVPLPPVAPAPPPPAPPPAAPPPAAPSANVYPPAMPEPDADDLLAKRLEALKRL